jgi:Xaa-Pro aminopeptidase
VSRFQPNRLDRVQVPESAMTATTTFLPTNAEVVAALRSRRERMRSTWTSPTCGLTSGVVIVPAGVPIPVSGTDAHYRFRAHDDHAWLAGVCEPGSVLVCDPQADGGDAAFRLFVHQADSDDRVWHGDGVSLEQAAEQSGLEHVASLAEFEAFLSSLSGRPVALFGNTDLLERPSSYEITPSALEALAFDAELTDRVERATHAARRVKDGVELALMRAAARATCAGHRAAMEHATPGMSEVALRIELEAAFLRAGADQLAYGSIVASGPNSAILHAAPTTRTFAADDLLLIDAGAEVRGYDCDVTRTFPVSGRFTGERQAVYDVVREVQQTAIDGAKPGVEYRDLHLEACRGIAAGLVEMGVLRGDPDGLVERDVHALFLPHGLGHLIGLSTHDGGGYLHGRERSDRPGLRYLRTDLPLEAGHVVTIEPGLYFIEALLRDPALRAEHGDAVDWERAEALLPVGGVRIEDTVHVTDGPAEVLSAAAPK